MDRQSAERVLFVTGTSSGIGRAVAARMAGRCWAVFGLVRNPAQESAEQRWESLVGDLTIEESLVAAIDAVVAQTGRLDAVVNCAGYGLAGAVEDTPLSEVAAQFETNLFGAWALSRAAVRVFRRQGAGRLVHVGSLGGRVGMPFQAAYSASKFALAGLVESLSAEVRNFGVRVALVEPGNVATAFSANRRAVRPDRSPYRATLDRVLAAQEGAEANGCSPDRVAAVVDRALSARRVRLRYTVGSFWERLGVRSKAVLPSRWFEALLMMGNGMGWPAR